MGLIKVRADHAAMLVEHYDSLDRDGTYDGKNFRNLYMTSFLQSLIDSGKPIRAVCINGGWIEVDTVNDLLLYEQLHADNKLDKFIDLDAKG